jgi:hypothetical protein
LGLALASCSTLPKQPKKDSRFAFPKGSAFVGDVKRPYIVLGPVRSKVDFSSMGEVIPSSSSDDASDDSPSAGALCRNYYNKSVRELIKFAKKQGGDAVIDVKSIVFMDDGKSETYKTPECSDDGGEGQILTQGVAVKWKGELAETGTWTDEAKATPGPPGGKDALVREKKGPLLESPPEAVSEYSDAERVTETPVKRSKKKRREHRKDAPDEKAEKKDVEEKRLTPGFNPADPRTQPGAR